MATFDHTLTEADIGAILDPANGFVVSLSQTAPTTDRGDPQWSASLLRWKTGYLALRGEGDTQAIYCCRPGGWTPLWVGDTRILIVSASLQFRGRLVVQCVPKGATYQLTLSDVPVTRPPRGNVDGGNFGDFPSWRHSRRPGLPREAV